MPKRIVTALVSNGVQTSVLTGIPHYPSGRVAPGYTAARGLTESVDGVEVQRTPEYPSHSQSAIRRIVTYLSWAVTASCGGARRLSRADVNLVYSSPATSAIPGLIAKFLFGTPYVLMVQDLWPDSIAATGFDRPALRPLTRLLDAACNLFYRHAAHVCVISPGMIDLLVARGVPRAKISLVFNWADDEEPVDTVEPREGPRRLLYAGNHGSAQSLSSLVSVVASRDDVVLSLVGDGIEKQSLMEQAALLGAANIVFHDPVSPGELSRFIRMSDIQIVSLGDHPVFHSTMPSKVQSILAAGRPVIAIAGGDVCRVVEDAVCGWTAKPGDIKSISRAVSSAATASSAQLATYGQNAARYYASHMTERENVDRLLRVLRDATLKAGGK